MQRISCGSIVLGCLLLAMPASAQVARIGAPRPGPQVTIGDTLTLTVMPGTVSFQLVSRGIALGSNPIAVKTTWTGISLLSSISLYAFFSSSTAALTGGTPTSNIPTANVLGMVTTGLPTSFTPFTQSNTVGVAGAGLRLFAMSSILSIGGTRTDNVSLEIDLTSLPQLPAAVYTGQLLLQAQAF